MLYLHKQCTFASAVTNYIVCGCQVLRMRRSRDVPHSNETYAEPSIHHVDVPIEPNEAYTLHQISSPSEDVTYETVK